MFDDTDKGIIREYMNDGHLPAEEPLTLKLYVSTTPGDPTKGIAKTFVWQTIPYYGTVTAVEQRDVMYSGGLYQVGDIKVQLQRLLQPIDDATGKVGDRIVWKGHEYRQIGNVSPNYLESYVLYNYVFRRI